ncbi:histidine phosphatase family protein [Paracoccus aurantiacus]|uniref:Histidine phosphatase family protein n=1 Tax=Paracoccus aurantiacus TaxID=2599412 RepID=A0A5C6S0I0_9RHOB|nr:histidine phosphatase family protein [Paracoccus aurantiacus]TXB68031.1 histidine phosphatase family protein [Paracoccus aurantiacus]
MPGTARYLTHPQVQVDPDRDVPRWTLNDTGRARVAALAAAPGLLSGTSRIISSAEVKAVETAEPLARALGLQLEIRPLMHENDRSATGFLPPPEFEAMADAFFARPDDSIRGWEPARAAQARILSEVEAVLAGHDTGDVLFVGHGGVGTLLYCALAQEAIDRRFDQGPGGGGNWFGFDILSRKAALGWQPMETLSD